MSTASDNQLEQTPICTVDPYEYIQIKRNSDGTFTRLLNFPSTPATTDPDSNDLALSKDGPLNPFHNTYLRIYLPKVALSTNNKLPIIVYFHGGGFVILHADSTYSHDVCLGLASYGPVIIVSVDYRLAPEYRLPAAYEDAAEALHWISASAAENDEWLSKYGDFNNCFLMGSSAGGNIAYHAALRALNHVDDLKPLQIKGLILHQPFFGGSERTQSELQNVNNPTLPLSGSDLFWELSLPVGEDRDHEFSNPMTGSGSDQMEKMKKSGWRILVTDCCGDPLFDRVKEYVKMLEEKGVSVKGHFTEGGYHGLEVIDVTTREPFYRIVHDFVKSCINAS